MKNIVTKIWGAALCLALSYTATAQTVSDAHTLSITPYQQEQSQWCWAATTRMVDWSYSSVTPPSQCSIVNAANNTCDGWFNVCCGELNGSRPSACTDPLGSNYPNSMYGCNGSLSWLLNNYAGANTTYSSSLAYSTVSSNLANKKMMVARWGWTSGGGHFVVIYGNYMLNTTQHVSYANPGSASKVTETYAYFKSNASRTWTHSIAMNGGTARRVTKPTTSTPTPVSLNNDAALARNVKVYPNPSDGSFQLVRQEDVASPAKVTITNALGAVVYETVLPEGQREATVELKNKLSAGLYLVNMETNGERTIEKLLVR